MPVYQPLPSGEWIRVLKLQRDNTGVIRGDLIVEKREKLENKYIAVSWCWGLETNVDFPMADSSLPVRPTLIHLFEVLCEHLCQYFWIDQICINQTDAAEKAVVIPLMHEIYKSALGVFLWLGPSYANSDEAMACLEGSSRGFYKHQNETAYGKESETKSKIAVWMSPSTVHDEIKAIFLHPCWTRLWIMQELITAKRIKVYLGSKSLHWNAFVLLFGELRWDPLGLDRTWSDPLEDDEVDSSKIRIIHTWRTSSFESNDTSVCQAFLLSRKLSCRFAVDHIWAILALLGPEIRALVAQANILEAVPLDEHGEPIISETRQQAMYLRVLYRFNRLLLGRGRCIGLLGMTHPGDHRGLPSWCPDWSQPPIDEYRALCKCHHAGCQVKLARKPSIITEFPILSKQQILVAGLACDIASATVTSSGTRIEDFDALIQHEQECAKMARDTSPDEVTAITQHWRLISGDRLRHEYETGLSAYEGYVQWQRDLLEYAKEIRELEQKNKQQEQSSAIDWKSLIGERSTRKKILERTRNVACAANRRYFRTVSGRLGVGPLSTRVEDVVAVLDGAQTPFILRYAEKSTSKVEHTFEGVQRAIAIRPRSGNEDTDSSYDLHAATLVGTAFLPFLMRGEAYGIPDTIPEMFVLE